MVAVASLRLFSSFLAALIALPAVAMAHCPLCTAATGMAVAGARVYGIDDLFVGMFFGAFVVSGAFWTSNLIKKRMKKEYLPYQDIVLTILFLTTTILTYYLGGLLGSNAADMKMLGVDKLFFGTLAGTFMTSAAFYAHDLLRFRNGGKNYLPFQSMVLALLFVSLASFGFYIGGFV